MATQPVFLPVSQGVHEETDPRVAQVGHLLEATNVRYDRRGALIPRRGFDVLGSSVLVGQGRTVAETSTGAMRTLFSTSRELCGITSVGLYAYQPETGRWVWRGLVSPGCGHVRDVEQGFFLPYGGGSMCGGDGYRLVALSYQARDAAGDTYQLHLSFYEEGSGLVLRDRAYGQTTTVQNPGVVQCLYYPAESTYVAYYAADDAGTDRIRAAYVDANALLLGVQDAGFTSSSLGGARAGQYFDACLVNDAPAVPQISVSLALSVERGVTISPRTFAYTDATRDYLGVTALEQASGQADGVYYLLYWYDAGGEEEPALALAKLVASGETGPDTRVWEATVETPVVGAPTLHGVAEVVASDGHTYIYGVWSDENESSQNGVASATGVKHLHYAYVRDTGSSFSGLTTGTRHNCGGVGRVFSHSGRACVPIRTFSGFAGDDSSVGLGLDSIYQSIPDTVSPSAVLACNAILDLPNPTDRDPGWSVVGHFGQGSPLRGTGQIMTDATGVEWLLASSTAGRLSGSARVHRLDFAATPMATAYADGAAVIGGSAVLWYDGAIVQELGFLTPPCIERLALSNPVSPPGSLSETSYFYTPLWVTYDASGFVHRSTPGVTAERAVVAPNDTISLYTMTNPATSREGRQIVRLLYYRASDGSVAQELRDDAFADIVDNFPSTYFDTLELDDGGNEDYLGVPLYTESGELEAVPPNGAQIPVIVGDRLYFGGFWSGDRFQYSKPIVQGTATEDKLAPETNEGFGYVLEGGQDITGMGPLDDSLVVFTESAVYINAGQGPADNGAGSGFSGPRLVSSDAGCVEPRSVVSTPDGLMFLSRAGIYLLGRDHRLSFVGEPVKETLQAYPVVTSAVLVPEDNEVRFTVTSADGADGRVVVYSYAFQAWLVWSVLGAGGEPVAPLAGCYHQPEPATRGRYVIAHSSGLLEESRSGSQVDSGTQAFTCSVRPGWLQAAQHGGRQSVRSVTAMAAQEPTWSAGDITAEVYTDFAGSAGQSYTWAYADVVAEATAVPELPLRLTVAERRNYAMSPRLSWSSTAPLRLSGFLLEVGAEPRAAQHSRFQR